MLSRLFGSSSSSSSSSSPTRLPSGPPPSYQAAATDTKELSTIQEKATVAETNPSSKSNADTVHNGQFKLTTSEPLVYNAGQFHRQVCSYGDNCHGPFNVLDVNKFAAKNPDIARQLDWHPDVVKWGTDFNDKEFPPFPTGGQDGNVHVIMIFAREVTKSLTELIDGMVRVTPHPVVVKVVDSDDENSASSFSTSCAQEVPEETGAIIYTSSMDLNIDGQSRKLVLKVISSPGATQPNQCNFRSVINFECPEQTTTILGAYIKARVGRYFPAEGEFSIPVDVDDVKAASTTTGILAEQVIPKVSFPSERQFPATPWVEWKYLSDGKRLPRHNWLHHLTYDNVARKVNPELKDIPIEFSVGVRILVHAGPSRPKRFDAFTITNNTIIHNILDTSKPEHYMHWTMKSSKEANYKKSTGGMDVAGYQNHQIWHEQDKDQKAKFKRGEGFSMPD